MDSPEGAPHSQEPQREGLARRFRSILRGGILYLQARQRLFIIEAVEATAFLVNRGTRAVLALFFLAFGYALLLAGGILFLSRLLPMPWWFLCLILAPLHLLLGWLFLRAARRRPETPLFEESRNELRKDRDWLSNSNEPWW